MMLHQVKFIDTLWWRCHRRLIAELLAAAATTSCTSSVPGRSERHRPAREADYRDGRLYLCGHEVA